MKPDSAIYAEDRPSTVVRTAKSSGFDDNLMGDPASAILVAFSWRAADLASSASLWKRLSTLAACMRPQS